MWNTHTVTSPPNTHTHTHTHTHTCKTKNWRGKETDVSPCWFMVVWSNIFFIFCVVLYLWYLNIYIVNYLVQSMHHHNRTWFKWIKKLQNIIIAFQWNLPWNSNSLKSVSCHALGKKISDHTTILQVDTSGGLNLICALQHISLDCSFINPLS